MTECDQIIIIFRCCINEKDKHYSNKIDKFMGTASTSCHIRKVRDWYIFHTVLLVIILLLIITIICYHYAKQKRII